MSRRGATDRDELLLGDLETSPKKSACSPLRLVISFIIITGLAIGIILAFIKHHYHVIMHHRQRSLSISLIWP